MTILAVSIVIGRLGLIFFVGLNLNCGILLFPLSLFFSLFFFFFLSLFYLFLEEFFFYIFLSIFWFSMLFNQE